MSEAEKQEGQKTVVAFITGLLIGGLLVWVFSSTPEGTTQQTNSEDVTTEETANADEDENDSEEVLTKESNVTEKSEGALTVRNQSAGNTVTLSDVTYPGTDGWIVVRDFTNGVLGNVLGAARYSTKEGLLPTSVSLLRNTIAGNTYQVVFHTDNGDKKFSTAQDIVVEGDAMTFKAE